MKIEKIEMCNLASIEGEQEIDFTQEPLKSAGLFAITGNTGAGKSTVLDAICLALYNEAPRLGNKEVSARSAKSEGPSVYNTCNVLRRGANHGYSKVTFSLADGARYVAKWFVGLTRNNTYKPIQRELVQLAPKHQTLADKSMDVQNLIRQIVKLDYSQFTRTVILAQNGFSNFLSAKKNEKSQLLEKITGTEVYARISRNIHEETKAAEQEATGARQHMDGLGKGALQPEDLKQLEEGLHLRLGQLSKCKEELENVLRQQDWLAQYEVAVADHEQKQAALYDAHQKYNSYYDQQRDLERYDLLQPFAKTYSNIRQAEANISRLKGEISVKEADADQLRHSVEINHSRYKGANDRLLAARRNLANQMPNINRGRHIQGKLDGLQDTLKTTNDELQRNAEELSLRTDSRNSKEAELNDCSKRLGEARLAMQQIRQHQTMVGQMEYVRTHLQKMNDLRLNIRDKDAQLSEHTQDLQRCKSRAQQEEENVHKLQASLSRQKGELLLHEQANKGQTSQDIQSRFARLSDLAMRSANAIRLWNHIDRHFSEISNKTDEIRRRRTMHEQKADEIKQKQISLEKLNYEYEQMQRAYTLSQSEDITNLRQSLKEGSPCPLCGATHHPFHSDSARQLTDLLDNLTGQYQRLFEDLQTAKSQLAELQQAYDNEEGQLRVETELLERMREEQKEDINAWQQYADLDRSFAQCDENVNRDNRRVILHQINESSNRERDEAKAMLDEFTKHQDEINRINSEIKDVQQQITDTARRQTEISAHKTLLDNMIAACQKEIEDSKHKLAEEISLVDPLMTIPGWQDSWTNSYEVFDHELASIKSRWDNSNEVLEEEQRNLFRLQQELGALDKALSDLQQNRRELTGKADVLMQSINRLKADLYTLFGNSTVDKEADRLDAAIKSAEEDAADASSKYTEAQKNLDNISGEIKSLQEECNGREKEQRVLRTELDVEISRFNMGQDYTLQYFELERYFSSPQDWSKLRATIDSLKKRLSEEQFKVDAAAQVVAKLEASPNRPVEQDESKSILADRREALATQLRELEEDRASIEFKIKTHRKSVQDMEFYRPTLEKAEHNYSKWRELCDVLGSADGNAFREIAQCYTFDFLVDFANVQLADLTPRYKLRAHPGTLQLDVIDRYMLDQVRAVNSLSGGETFIVSLSLALGLSALSSNNLEIGSLFIDEGFGNLDNDNLNMVIDALSNLQSTQRRQVGVISHTELIQLRISPKICLVPEPGGRSKIEIKG